MRVEGHHGTKIKGEILQGDHVVDRFVPAMPRSVGYEFLDYLLIKNTVAQFDV